MGHARILEYPVKEWRDVPGSKVRIGREMFRVGGDLLRIRKVYGRAGGWRTSSSQSTVASGLKTDGGERMAEVRGRRAEIREQM
jgi:hypothetical protein